jgi:hypothetical protein
MERAFIPGSVWQLSVNANCIPAGTYRFEEIQDEFLIFSVGSKISFGLTKDFYLPFLNPVLHADGRATSTDAFLATYAELFHRQSLFAPGIKGMTYCVMHPSLQIKFRKLTRLRKGSDRHAPIH